MSGPVSTEDVAAVEGSGERTAGPTIEITPSREAVVGQQKVRRALPRRTRRTVGAWCFIDHMGPATVPDAGGVGIGPHPHMGLQTVTWLVAGELLHRDSLGSEQLIRPGQLNLMSAGQGIAHAEEATAYRGEFQGLQLWVAQPERTRNGPPAFEHHRELPQAQFDRAVATLLVGELDGSASPARRDTEHVGVDLVLQPGSSVVPLRSGFEHALVMIEGAAVIDGRTVEPANLAYFGTGRDELALRVEVPSRGLLVGGVPFGSPVLMWWNFVARSQDEVTAAQRAWNSDDGRFGAVASTMDRIDAPAPPWTSSAAAGLGE
jgi:redox-sensitive bicupin YhaK (pirin superfamily)